MHTRSPEVSIGLPVYNGEKYLTNALNRLLGQEFSDFELIISDNASTDGTQDICRLFAGKDRRIRYFRNEKNIGLAANHNRTFELSNGKYFKWAAHDDDFPSTMLARFVKEFRGAPPSVAVVYSYWEYINERGEVVGMNSDRVHKKSAWPHKRLGHLLRHIHMYNSPYGLIRASMLRKTQLHGLYPGSDYVLMSELAMLGRFVEIHEPLLRIRQHPGRTFTANTTEHKLRELFAPGEGQHFSFVSIRTRMKLEVVRSALMLPLRPRDKLLCTAVALVKPHWEDFRAYGGKQKHKVLKWFHLSGVHMHDAKE